MPKQYRLLKDMPGVPAGTIFKFDAAYSRYYPVLETDVNMQYNGSWILENNPDWFEEVENYNSKLVVYIGDSIYPVLALDYRKNIVIVLKDEKEKSLLLSDVGIKIKI